MQPFELTSDQDTPKSSLVDILHGGEEGYNVYLKFSRQIRGLPISKEIDTEPTLETRGRLNDKLLRDPFSLYNQGCNETDLVNLYLDSHFSINAKKCIQKELNTPDSFPAVFRRLVFQGVSVGEALFILCLAKFVKQQ